MKKVNLILTTLAATIGTSFSVYAEVGSPSEAPYEDLTDRVYESNIELVDDVSIDKNTSEVDENAAELSQNFNEEPDLNEKADDEFTWIDLINLQREVCSDMPNSVDYSIIYSEESALEYYEQYFTPEIQEKYGIDLEVRIFSEPHLSVKNDEINISDGRVWIDINTDDPDVHTFDVIHITVDDPSGIIDSYVDITTELDSLSTQFGSLSIIQFYGITNEAQIIEHIRELVPSHDEIGYELRVSRPGTIITPGTTLQPSTYGIRMTIWDEETPESKLDCGIVCYIRVYSDSSSVTSGSDSSDRNHIYAPTDPVIYRDSVNFGTWENNGGKWRLRLPDGSLAVSQWAFLGDKWYLIGQDYYMLTGWQKVDNTWYYFNQEGVMLVGWNNIDNKWYYFDSNGKMLSNAMSPDGYYLDHSGVWVR